MLENHYLVPLHPEGFKKDLEHHIVAYTTEDAEYWFVDVKDRLMDVNNWNKYCPGISAEFRLTDSHGMGVRRHARKGDHIRMDMPGQGKERLSGFEWLHIEAIEYDDYPDISIETFAIRLRKAHNPLDRKDGHPGTAQDATFTLVIERRGPKLFVSCHGRDETGMAGDAATGAWFGLPEAEWSSLIKKILG